MKRILLIALLLSTLSIKSQINQDFSYQSSYYLLQVRLTGNNYKYLVVDYNQDYFTLLNLDGSFFKSISIPPGSGTSPTNSGPYSISSSVFDTDSSSIEYMINYEWDSTANYRKHCTQVLREDGSVLLNETDAQFPGIWNPQFSNSPLIYNTPEGTKLKLEYSYANTQYGIYKTTIFSLPGNLPTAENNGLVFTNNSLSLFPNPNNGVFSIKLKDIQEISKIELYSSDGKLIKIIQSKENPIDISGEILNDGCYFLKIYNKYSNPTTEKIIILK